MSKYNDLLKKVTCLEQEIKNIHLRIGGEYSYPQTGQTGIWGGPGYNMFNDIDIAIQIGAICRYLGISISKITQPSTTTVTAEKERKN